MKTRIPPYLKKGDKIGLVAPAGFMFPEKYRQCVKTLTEWGFDVVMGETPGHQFHYFSGTDDERIDDLQGMLDDPEIRAVLCVRGGYGTGRIIDRLDFKKFKRNPKWIIGFSDVTVLHCHIFSNVQTATIHGPMAGAFDGEGYRNEYAQSLFSVLKGKRVQYKIPVSPINRSGKCEGVLIGGNLSLLTNMVGTKSDLNTDNKILLIEDIGEYIYHIDRMMYQLRRSGKLNKLSGLIIGSFNDMKDTTTPFGKNVEEVISDLVKEYNYPVCFHFPAGHEKENLALKLGVRYQLDVGKRSVTLKEL